MSDLPEAAEVAERLASVRGRCAAACGRVGRDPSSVLLLAVSKTWPAQVVRHAFDAGQLAFGENKVQEGQEKVPLCAEEIEWHLIGHLQRNKVRKALPLFSTLHGIDSLKLASAVDRVASEFELRPRILLEVNVGGETSKAGFDLEALRQVYPSILELKSVDLIGLMCIPPEVDEPDQARPFFRQLLALRDELVALHGHPLPELSMGMSGDFEAAIEEGSTMVRVGSAIFGQRHYPKSS